eukprot:scaffold20934_cov116-Isochrysis_galbana.AAC.6
MHLASGDARGAGANHVGHPEHHHDLGRRVAVGRAAEAKPDAAEPAVAPPVPAVDGRLRELRVAPPNRPVPEVLNQVVGEGRARAAHAHDAVLTRLRHVHPAHLPACGVAQKHGAAARLEHARVEQVTVGDAQVRHLVHHVETNVASTLDAQPRKVVVHLRLAELVGAPLVGGESRDADAILGRVQNVQVGNPCRGAGARGALEPRLGRGEGAQIGAAGLHDARAGPVLADVAASLQQGHRLVDHARPYEQDHVPLDAGSDSAEHGGRVGHHIALASHIQLARSRAWRQQQHREGVPAHPDGQAPSARLLRPRPRFQ